MRFNVCTANLPFHPAKADSMLPSRPEKQSLDNLAQERPPALLDWELTELLGEGTLCAVYRARPAGTDRSQPAAYAVKCLRSLWRNDEKAKRLLEREAQVGQEVSHPRLVAVLEASLDFEPRYLVMPYLEGRGVDRLLSGGRRIVVNKALWIARQAAEALGSLHEKGWTHGDVKPANLLVSGGGRATLIDLGFARRLGGGTDSLDRTLSCSPHYCAPERSTLAAPADPRSDFYALGASLFHMITGRTPFEGSTAAELLARHKESPPADPRGYVSSLDPSLANLILALLAKNPNDRPTTADELVQLLQHLEIDALSREVME